MSMAKPLWPEYEGVARPIKPRNIPVDVRCTDCRSADFMHPELPAVRHPAHPWSPCNVRTLGQECGCTSGMRPLPPAQYGA